MKGATSIQERLWELRKDKGLNLEELSELTGISKSALGNYEKEDYKEINHGNLITLADFYGVSVDYLLCRTENREQINIPLTELHLNDEMVALLKSGRINNRLLCELTTHKDFIKFLADIEIYVDGIATMQIQNLNALVDTVRHEIIERYRPGEDDPHLKVLQAAHISDDEYFSHMVLDDLNLIIRDIREAHKKDSESAPQTTVADELKENLEAVENFKGSRDEKLVVLYCKQLGINYKNLSDEEFRWLIRILKKSKKMGTPISQRKKWKRKTAVAWFVGFIPCSSGSCCDYSVRISERQAGSYSAIFFHFLILVLKVPNGATVLTCMNLYTSQTAVLVASSAHFLICGLNNSSSLRESIIA